jgi:hypothetical protein
MAVLWNLGNGSFSSPSLHPLAGITVRIACADLDGDLLPDVITANQGGDTLGIFRNLGSGSFEPPQRLLAGTSPTGVACADLDGIGLPELVSCNYGTNSVTVLWNTSARISAFCAGDGSSGPCPCGNTGASGSGCANSASSGGALLSAAGFSSLAADSLVLSATGEPTGVPTLLLEGAAAGTSHAFGDGLACVAGTRRMLYLHTAPGGVFTAPDATEPPISVRSAALGAPIHAGETRYYQACYRDPSAVFCPPPGGATWNTSSGLAVVWGF